MIKTILKRVAEYEDWVRAHNPGLSEDFIKLLGRAFVTGASCQKEIDIEICKDTRLGGLSESFKNVAEVVQGKIERST